MKPRHLLILALVFIVSCCAVKGDILRPRYDAPIRAEVRVVMDTMNRVELFAGGIHVGTIIFDTHGGGVFVGETPQKASEVIAAFLAMLSMHKAARESRGETYH
jgi:hypothetical protein